MESYTLLQSLNDVIKDVNDLIENPTLDGIPLKIILGGDYKVHTCTYMYIHVHHVLHAAHIHELLRWVGRVPMGQRAF